MYQLFFHLKIGQSRLSLLKFEDLQILSQPSFKIKLCQIFTQFLYYDVQQYSFDHKHLSLKEQYIEFNINVPLRQQYIKNLMLKIYDVKLLICTIL